MGPAIPASHIVSVTPSVIAAGGTGVNLTGVMLTESGRVPVGQVLRFSGQLDVAAYFGLDSPEAAIAASYFLGFDNSNIKPSFMMFTQYNAGQTTAWMRGGNLGVMTLDELQEIEGTLTIVVDGTTHTSHFDLDGATSFSAVADGFASAFGITVHYDPIGRSFVFTSATPGPTGNVSFGSGDMADALMLVPSLGAVQSAGQEAATPQGVMNNVIAQTGDWATFATMFDPGVAGRREFAQWCGRQQNKIAYIAWDNDPNAIQGDAPDSFGEYVRRANLSGVMPIWSPAQGPVLAAFIMGAIASIDFNERDGRTTMAFRRQPGIEPDVVSQTVADNLRSHAYNFYGIWSTTNEVFTFAYPGSIGGDFIWADSYVNQIWLNNNLQLALMRLITSRKSIPYNTEGYSLIRATLIDPVSRALTFGAIRTGIPLSAMQVAAVNSDAGMRIDDTLRVDGYFIQVQPASPQVRAMRGSPPIKFWYTDGGSIQKIELASIMVQ